MAYLDLDQPMRGLLSAAEMAPDAAPAAGRLSKLDRMVIALSRHDPRSSLAAPGRFRKIITYLFSLQPPNPLADPRLEALRRFSVMLRKQRAHFPEDETLRLLAAGYSPAAIQETREIIGREFAAA